jgi:1,4-alpha-glucan branching enzyme
VIEKRYITVKGQPVCRVTLTLPQSMWAVEVRLLGDFNEWRHDATPMSRSRAGDWTVTLDLEVGKTYQMRYLIDDTRWLNDPSADGYVDNTFGSDNFVVVTDPAFRK